MFACGFVSSAYAEQEYAYSGFIDNYPELQLDKDGSGAMIYRKPGMELGGYQKLMIDPIEIWYAEDSKYKGISPDDLKAITDALYESVVAQLEPDYPVVSRSGEGVLRIRLAITDVYAKKKKRGLLGYTPIGLVVGGVKSLAGVAKNIKLEDATIEGELLDAQSSEQVGVLIDKLSVSKAGKEKDTKTSWEEIATSLDFYAKRLRSRLDAEHRK
jgi:hypothetical protein